jgi:hypothetical protein
MVGVGVPLDLEGGNSNQFGAQMNMPEHQSFVDQSQHKGFYPGPGQHAMYHHMPHPMHYGMPEYPCDCHLRMNQNRPMERPDMGPSQDEHMANKFQPTA